MLMRAKKKTYFLIVERKWLRTSSSLEEKSVEESSSIFCRHRGKRKMTVETLRSSIGTKALETEQSC